MRKFKITYEKKGTHGKRHKITETVSKDLKSQHYATVKQAYEDAKERAKNNGWLLVSVTEMGA